MFLQNHQLMEGTRFIIRDVEQDLTETLRQSAINRTARLFRPGENIESIRIDLEIDRSRGPAERFVARGRLEAGGAELVASVHSENTYKSIDQLVDILDAQLHPRRTELETPSPLR